MRHRRTPRPKRLPSSLLVGTDNDHGIIVPQEIAEKVSGMVESLKSPLAVLLCMIYMNSAAELSSVGSGPQGSCTSDLDLESGMQQAFQNIDIDPLSALTGGNPTELAIVSSFLIHLSFLFRKLMNIVKVMFFPLRILVGIMKFVFYYVGNLFISPAPVSAAFMNYDSSYDVGSAYSYDPTEHYGHHGFWGEDEDLMEQDADDDAMFQNRSRGGKSRGGDARTDSTHAFDLFGSSTKIAPKVRKGASWKRVKKGYENWLLGCELPSGKELAHILQHGFVHHEKWTYYADLYREEHKDKICLQRPRRKKKVKQSPAIGATVRSATDLAAPRQRRFTRSPPAGDEDEATKDARLAQEREEDEQDDFAMQEYLRGSDAGGAEEEEEEDDREQAATGDVAVDWPAWHQFTLWIDAKILDTNPINCMKRWNRWLRYKRRPGQSYEQFIDQWMAYRREVKQDGLFWEQVDNESFQATILFQGLDLPHNLVVEFMTKLSIDTAENIKKSMNFEAIQEAVNKYDKMPKLVTSGQALPAEVTSGMRPQRSGRGHYVDNGSYPSYANYSGAQPAYPSSNAFNPYTAYSVGQAAEAVFGTSGDFNGGKGDPDLYDHYATGDDCEQVGWLSAGRYDRQQENCSTGVHICAVFWSALLSKEVYYDQESYTYLLKNQCAKCGEVGHWWKDCPNGERNFKGKPNRPKTIVKHANLIAQANNEAMKLKGKKGKGQKGYGKGPPPQNKGNQKAHVACDLCALAHEPGECEFENEREEVVFEEDAYGAQSKGGRRGTFVKRRTFRRKRGKGGPRRTPGRKGYFLEEGELFVLLDDDNSSTYYAGYNATTYAPNPNPDYVGDMAAWSGLAASWMVTEETPDLSDFTNFSFSAGDVQKIFCASFCRKCKIRYVPYCACEDSVAILKLNLPDKEKRELRKEITKINDQVIDKLVEHCVEAKSREFNVPKSQQKHLRKFIFDAVNGVEATVKSLADPTVRELRDQAVKELHDFQQKSASEDTRRFTAESWLAKEQVSAGPAPPPPPTPENRGFQIEITPRDEEPSGPTLLIQKDPSLRSNVIKTIEPQLKICKLLKSLYRSCMNDETTLILFDMQKRAELQKQYPYPVYLFAGAPIGEPDLEGVDADQEGALKRSIEQMLPSDESVSHISEMQTFDQIGDGLQSFNLNDPDNKIQYVHFSPVDEQDNFLLEYRPEDSITDMREGGAAFGPQPDKAVQFENCFICGMTGHWPRACPKNQSHVKKEKKKRQGL